MDRRLVRALSDIGTHYQHWRKPMMLMRYRLGRTVNEPRLSWLLDGDMYTAEVVLHIA
jgi:hypothetical protein